MGPVSRWRLNQGRNVNFIRFIFGLAVLAASMAASAQTRLDGNWWRNLDKSERTYFLAGYMQGVQMLAQVAPAVVCIDTTNGGGELSGCILKISSSLEKRFTSPAAGKPYGQFIDGVSTVYEDYRNRGICFTGVMNFVLKEIGGLSGEAREQFLVNLRQANIDTPCN